jgi:predicted Zn-ribbon and HTH transcriptional regulator
MAGSVEEECTVCGWQGKAAALKGGLCPECGSETVPPEQIYGDDPRPIEGD